MIDDINEERNYSQDTSSDDGVKQMLEDIVKKSYAEGEITTNIGQERKESYCKTWMQNEDRIKTENAEPPPSLYASSVTLSESLLDTTSVSQYNNNNSKTNTKKR